MPLPLYSSVPSAPHLNALKPLNRWCGPSAKPAVLLQAVANHPPFTFAIFWGPKTWLLLTLYKPGTLSQPPLFGLVLATFFRGTQWKFCRRRRRRSEYDKLRKMANQCPAKQGRGQSLTPVHTTGGTCRGDLLSWSYHVDPPLITFSFTNHQGLVTAQLWREELPRVRKYKKGQSKVWTA